MLPAGPLPGNLVAIGAGQGRPGIDAQGLKAGAVVSVRVLADLGGGLYRVAAGASVFAARSDRALGVGSSFQARVERRGEALALRALAERPATPIAAQAAAAAAGGGAGDPAMGAAIAALLREGAAPRPEALARLRRAFGRALAAGEDTGEADRAELAARLEAEGLPADEELLDAIHAEAGGSGERRGGESERGGAEAGGGDRREEGGRAAAGAEASFDLDRPFELRLPGSELPQALARLLKGIAFRAGGEGSFLNLFNHARGPEGSWSYAPFHFELDSIAFDGTLRIRSPYLKGGQGRIEASFRTSRIDSAANVDSGRRWTLGLDFGASTLAELKLGTADPGISVRAEERLPELVASLAEGGSQARVRLAAARGPRPEGSSGVEGVDVQA